MSILIVDDSPDSRQLLETTLRAGGYQELQTAASASEAFQLLGVDMPVPSSIKVDLILLDILMPVMDGVEACRRIKRTGHLEEVPVIMVTAKAGDDDLRFAFVAGATDYVTKPIKSAELLARVGSALRLKHEQDQRKAHEKELVEATRQLEAVNQVLLRMASLDGLTAIPNRRRLDEFLDQEWRKGARAGTPLSLIMIDVDHFKLYNDTYGHQGGDDCLKRVAGALCRTVKRPGDLVARYGGEEFAVVLPDTPVEGAVLVAEALRAEMEAVALPHARSQTANHVTISVGAATTVPTRDLSPDALVAAADQALYRAKTAGRNRVVHAGSADKSQGEGSR